MKLERLCLKDFRGIHNLELDFQGKSAVLLRRRLKIRLHFPGCLNGFWSRSSMRHRSRNRIQPMRISR